MDNFRDLCAELVLSWDANGCDWRPQHQARWESTVARIRAALAVEAVGPSDEELNRLMDSIQWKGSPNHWGRKVARAVLARWGSAPRPIPVAERLPGAKDCAPWPDDPDATLWCWAGEEVDGCWEWTQLNMLGLGTDTLGRIIAGGGWTHWLPAHALPIPTQENHQ